MLCMLARPASASHRLTAAVAALAGPRPTPALRQARCVALRRAAWAACSAAARAARCTRCISSPALSSRAWRVACAAAACLHGQCAVSGGWRSGCTPDARCLAGDELSRHGLQLPGLSAVRCLHKQGALLRDSAESWQLSGFAQKWGLQPCPALPCSFSRHLCVLAAPALDHPSSEGHCAVEMGWLGAHLCSSVAASALAPRAASMSASCSASTACLAACAAAAPSRLHAARDG